MNSRTLTSALSIPFLLLFTSLALSLEIVLPEKTEEHNLVVVSFETEGDSLVIIQDKRTTDNVAYEQLSTEDPLHAYVFTGPPSTYKVQVITYKVGEGFGFATKETTITPSASPDPGDPGDPDTPTPAPPLPPQYAELEELSRSLAVPLNDRSTQELLSPAYAKAAQLIENSASIGAAVPIVQATISDAFKQRKGVSLTKDWLREWRVPVDKKISSIGITTVAQYQQALQAISKGLQ